MYLLDFINSKFVFMYLVCGIVFSGTVDILIKILPTLKKIYIDNWIRTLYILFWPIWIIIMIKHLFNNDNL